jgi:hypothetical protein
VVAALTMLGSRAASIEMLIRHLDDLDFAAGRPFRHRRVAIFLTVEVILDISVHFRGLFRPRIVTNPRKDNILAKRHKRATKTAIAKESCAMAAGAFWTKHR